MERNTDNSVRARIDAIVDRQERSPEVEMPKNGHRAKRERIKEPVEGRRRFGKKTLSRKAWISIISGLVAVIVVLTVAIVVVAVTPKGGDEGEEMNSIVETPTDKLPAEIDEKVSELGNENDIIDLYQEYIDEATGEEKAAILMARIQQVLSIDVERVYGDLVIADAIAVDDILQTLDSVGLVINVAASYGNNEVLEEYTEVMNERSETEGVDEDMETLG